MYMINSTEAIQELEAEIREMPWMANAEVKVHLADDTGPYIQYQVVTKFRIQKYNPKYEASNPPHCECGHAYYRHFDPYENWAAVGCKHCACGHFKPAPGHWSRMERAQSRCIGRAFGPLSPPQMIQSIRGKNDAEVPSAWSSNSIQSWSR